MTLGKSGTNKRRVVLQARDRLLLSELRLLRYVDREQASKLCGFTSVSRAKARLFALVCGGFLGRLFVGTIAGGRKAIYFLPGARRSKAPRALASPKTELFIEHQLSVNAVLLAARQVADGAALRERPWPALESLFARRIKPDAFCELRGGGFECGLAFEVDLGTESLSTIREKVRRYLALARSGRPLRTDGLARFRVLFVATGAQRLAAIRRVVAAETERVFWLAEIETITREGFWARVWLRPTGEERHSLI